MLISKDNLALLLSQTPPSLVGKDWKTFALQHPWYPSRLLVKHFGLKKYDLDNWKRVHPQVREALLRPPDNFREAESPSDILRSLTKAWRFFIENVLQLDLTQDTAGLSIAKLQGIGKSDWAFLLDSRILGKLNDYNDWIAQGYTQLAYVVFHIYPGRNWAETSGLRPSLFSQTSKIHTRGELVELLEHVYLRFLADLPQSPSPDDISDAKRVFYVRASEASFITNEVLSSYGFRAHMTPHGIKDIVNAVRQKFGADLGLEALAISNWSTSEFRKRFPKRELSVCQYCGRKPVDLHHLLERSEYPELIYEDDNVVPLCTLVHSAITRNVISVESARQLIRAAEQWKTSKDGRLATFDNVMRAIHNEIYAVSALSS